MSPPLPDCHHGVRPLRPNSKLLRHSFAPPPLGSSLIRRPSTRPCLFVQMMILTTRVPPLEQQLIVIVVIPITNRTSPRASERRNILILIHNNNNNNNNSTTSTIATSTSISTNISITTNPRQTRICPLLPPKSTRQPPPTPRAKPLCAPPITRTARTKSPLRTTAKAQPPFVHPPRVTLRRHCLASNCTRPFALPTAIRLPTRTQPPPLPPAPVPAPKAPHTRVTGDYAHLVPSSVRLASTHHNVMMRPRRSIAITLIAIRSTISRTMIRPRDRFPLLPRWIRTATRSDIAVSDSSVHVRIRNGPPLLVLSQHP
mmetsp:Transcript_5727/g.14552  ORF Transcript_5727/g.14552 Transcript_5727/m.14552 type:complete len:315 (-) Transcript_5727:1587-2531(-)